MRVRDTDDYEGNSLMGCADVSEGPAAPVVGVDIAYFYLT